MAFWNGKKEETMTNEYKYEEIDFGFTAVDEEELSKLSGADTCLLYTSPSPRDRG